ncbi:MAG TPA: hypothetical protein VGO93_08770 [Candidatus Xenobia bacterium]|jgi:hypothetical protein
MHNLAKRFFLLAVLLGSAHLWAQTDNLVRNGDLREHPSLEQAKKMPGYSEHAGAYVLDMKPGSSLVPPWQVTRGVASLSYWKDGAPCTFRLQDSGAIQTSIQTVPGKSYRVSFVSWADNEGPPEQALTVTIGDLVRHFKIKSTDQKAKVHEFIAPATSTSMTLEIGFDSGSIGPYIKNVRAALYDADAEAARASVKPRYNAWVEDLRHNDITAMMAQVAPDFQLKTDDGATKGRDDLAVAWQAIADHHASCTMGVAAGAVRTLDSTHLQVDVFQQETWDGYDLYQVAHHYLVERKLRDTWVTGADGKPLLSAREEMGVEEKVDGKTPSPTPTP